MPLTLAKQNGPVCFKYAGVAALRLAPLLSTFKEQHVFAAASTVIRNLGASTLFIHRERGEQCWWKEGEEEEKGGWDGGVWRIY